MKTPSNESSVQQEQVDPLLQRYSLSDAPMAYDNINNAMDQTLQHPAPEQTDTHVDPFRSVASSIEGHSPSTAASQPLTADYTPYQPGQYLAPIMTGETLQLDPVPPTSINGHTNPFNDLDTPISNSTTLVGHAHANPFHDPNTPLSNASTILVPAHNDRFYSQSTNSSYVSYEQDLHAGSEIDHFRHDTEAYASGHHSAASYRPPRSRSPTPAVDEEDYYLVGDESFHHTGLPKDHHGYDPEKVAHEDEYGGKETSYYSERGYLPNGQMVVFDPEPETPTSMVYSLPSETPLETRHFGPAPTGRVLRRHKSKRRVQLTNGNLVVDVDVPPKLVLPYRGQPETMKTRYTAVTCDPDDFEREGFILRQNQTGRRTELFIVMTMFNVHPFSLLFISVTHNFLCRKMRFCFAERCTA